MMVAALRDNVLLSGCAALGTATSRLGHIAAPERAAHSPHDPIVLTDKVQRLPEELGRHPRGETVCHVCWLVQVGGGLRKSCKRILNFR